MKDHEWLIGAASGCPDLSFQIGARIAGEANLAHGVHLPSPSHWTGPALGRYRQSFTTSNCASNVVKLAEHVVISARQNVSDGISFDYRETANVDDRAVVNLFVDVVAGGTITVVSRRKREIDTSAAAPFGRAGVKVDAQRDGIERILANDNMGSKSEQNARTLVDQGLVNFLSGPLGGTKQNLIEAGAQERFGSIRMGTSLTPQKKRFHGLRFRASRRGKSSRINASSVGLTQLRAEGTLARNPRL